MVKKILLVPLVLLGLAFILVASECFADVSDLFEQAKAYKKSGDYGQAETIYKSIVQDYPGTDDAFEAQKRLVILYIRWDKDSQAQSALDKLTTDFSSHPNLPKVHSIIAGRYGHFRKYEEAKGQYQQITQQYPDTSYADKAQLDIQKMDIMSLIEFGNSTATQSAIDKLIGDFPSHSYLPQALYAVAQKYKQMEEYEEAKGVLEQIIQRFPSSPQAMNARLHILKRDIMSLIESGEDDKAQTKIDELTTDFSGYPRFATAFKRIAEKCYHRAFQLENQGLESKAQQYFRNAATIWEMLINDLPQSPHTLEFHYWAGDCYHELGEFQKSAEHLQKALDDDPNNLNAWHAQFMVGYNYEKLKESRVISKAEANTKIKAAYQQLLQKYPACPAANAARSWLSRYGSN